LPVTGHERIKVHELRQAFRRTVGHARRDHPAVAMPDEHDVTKILELQHAENVRDVHFKVNMRAGQMHPFSQPGVGGGKELVSPCAKQWPHLLPAPAG
jgi:hypothetical protein